MPERPEPRDEGGPGASRARRGWTLRHAAAVATVAAGAAAMAAGLVLWREQVRAVTGPAEAASAEGAAPAAPTFGRGPRFSADEPPRREPVRWMGRVVRSSEATLPPGTECTLEAMLTTQRGRAPDVALACGGTLVWRTDPAASAGWGRRWAVSEHPGPRERTYRYGLAFAETAPPADGGPPPERPDLEIDTFQAGVRLERRGARYEVLVVLQDDLSEPREGPAFERRHTGAVPTFRSPAVFRGHVRAATGPAPAAAGDACEVRIRPEFLDLKDLDCRLLVRCTDRVLFPGFARCSVEDGEVRGAKDEQTSPDDGDPRLDLDLSRGSLMLEDRAQAGKWSVSVALDVDPAARSRP